MALAHHADDQAAELLMQTLQANPFAADSRVLLGQVKLRRGDAAGALEDFARVVVEQPSSGEGFVGLAEALLILGKVDQARIAIDKAKKAGAGDAHAKHIEGKVQLAKGRFFPAARVLQEADRDKPNNPEVLADLGFAQLGSRSFGQAEKSLRRSLALKRQPRPQEGLAELYTLRGKFAEAGRAYEVAAALAKAAKQKPEEVARLYMEGGKAWLKQGDQKGRFAQARRLFGQAAKVVPNDPEPLFQLAAAWDRDDKLKQAEAAYEKVFTVDANHAETMFRLGLVQIELQNDKRARELLEKFLATEPKGENARRAKEALKKLK
jgi:Flp pilus assembly protein TadD